MPKGIRDHKFKTPDDLFEGFPSEFIASTETLRVTSNMQRNNIRVSLYLRVLSNFGPTINRSLIFVFMYL